MKVTKMIFDSEIHTDEMTWKLYFDQHFMRIVPSFVEEIWLENKVSPSVKIFFQIKLKFSKNTIA